MGKIKILHDNDGAYGYPAGTIVDIYDLFRDFHKSDDCDENLWDYITGIPIPAAVEEIAKLWRFDYEFV